MQTHVLWVLLAASAVGVGCSRPGVVPKDPGVLEAACVRGRPLCAKSRWMACARDRHQCYRLGLWYETGYRGLVKKNPPRARQIFSQMCDRAEVLGCAALCRRHGQAARCVDLDLLRLSGQGTPMARVGRPVPRSRLLSSYAPRLGRACRAGDGVACIVGGLAFDVRRSIVSRRLGNCYDDKQRCFARACRVGSPLACAVLCHLGRTGHCVDLARLVLADHRMRSQRFREAERLLGDLCRRKVLRACTVLGMALLRGVPLLPDRSRALKLLEGACMAGYQRACAALRRLPSTPP